VNTTQEDIMELMGLYEIAQAAGVTPQAVSNWVKRKPEFPEPLALLASGAVWDGRAIRTWLQRQQLVSTEPARRREMHQFVVGEEYSFNAIAEVFGGHAYSGPR
jgi:predicted DNA-binding transcriptional regulator AlpA